MKLYKNKGVYYADYEDGSEPVKCEDCRQMLGRAFEKREVDRSLGRCVTSRGQSVERLVVPAKKTVKITIGDAIRI